MERKTFNQIPQHIREAIPPVLRDSAEKADVEFLVVTPEEVFTGDPIPFEKGMAQRALHVVSLIIELLDVANTAVRDNDSAKYMDVMSHINDLTDSPGINDDVMLCALGSPVWRMLVHLRLATHPHCDELHAIARKYCEAMGIEVDF